MTISSTRILTLSALCSGVVVHLLMIGSLLSEPFSLEHGVNLVGSRSHPQEAEDCRGYLDAWFHDTDRVPRGLDFFSIYQAGRNFLRGHSVYYGVRVHRLGDEALVVPYFSGFRYLPAYAYMFGTVLNILPPWSSYWAWIAVVELLLCVNLLLIRKYTMTPATQRLLAAMWLIYSPYYVELHIGQQSMVTATLIHICIITHQSKRPWMRDASYAGSVIWKINTALFLPVWVKLKRWKTLLSLSLLTALLSIPYFLMVNGSYAEFRSYFHHKFIAAGPNSLGFWTFFTQFLDHIGISHSGIRIILKIWSLLVIGVSGIATMLPKRIRFSNALMLWICVYFLTYQYVWEHHYVMLLPLFSAGMVDRELRKWTILLWIFCALPTPYFFFNIPDFRCPSCSGVFEEGVVSWNQSCSTARILVCFVVSQFQF